MTRVDRETLRAARRDPEVFARVLVGAELWPHQREVARSTARYRVICAGRQVGKSRLLAVLCLHQAFSTPGSRVLVVSAGEVAAQRLLDEVATLVTSSPLLAGSVLDETKSQVTLSNGSTIMSVPASQRQIRGWAVDLLVLDEAGFIDPDIWRAAEPVIIARPGSRVILCSSPWGTADHFFRVLWSRGMDAPDEMYASWHWPSSTSPLVDQRLLDEIRAREGDDYFEREYLAKWTDEAGAYFTVEEIESATADYRLLPPDEVGQVTRNARPYVVAAGVDWGVSRDANALCLVAPLDDKGLNDPNDGLRYFVPWLEYAYRCPYGEWIERICTVGRAYGLHVVASEINGVGAYPTEQLRERLAVVGAVYGVAGVWTDNRRKQAGFGKLKAMLQRGQLVLPRVPELLKQLRSLEFEQMPGGSLRIEVPARAGHDDLVLALMQAISCVRPMPGQARRRVADMDHTVTRLGVRVPVEAWPLAWHTASYTWPAGSQADNTAW
ncbi:terminase large subunit domain-containing protein [Nonomuraea sp. NPDC050153]|uniref:terminase large subunit domain-containing protein n=1 Tax=Nonomuraea sp. NPDC050153 TaxID=3364359 RepID=UPI0037943EFE